MLIVPAVAVLKATDSSSAISIRSGHVVSEHTHTHIYIYASISWFSSRHRICTLYSSILLNFLHFLDECLQEPTPASGAVQRRPASSGASNRGGGGRRRRAAASSRSTVEMRASAWAKHHRDEVARMHEMLKRDYASKARRRSPINNGEPSLEEEDLP